MNAQRCRSITQVKIWKVIIFDDRDPMFTDHRLDVLRHALSILIKTPQGVEPRRYGKVDDPTGNLIRQHGKHVIVIAHCPSCVYSFLIKTHPDRGYMIEGVLTPPGELRYGSLNVPLA